MLSNWLDCKARDPSPYGKFKLTEIDERTEITTALESYLIKLVEEARFDPSFLQDVARRHGWSKVMTYLVAPTMPTVTRARRGFFGEVLTCALLTEVFGYLMPVPKLRFNITSDQSLPGTDAIVVKKSPNGISEICFVESKLRTVTDPHFAVQGYRQLREDYSQEIPVMIRFVLARLHETKNPLFDDMMKYAFDRRDTTGMETFSLGLISEHEAWRESALENLEQEASDGELPKLVVHRTKIRNLASLVERVLKSAGVETIPYDE